MKRDEQTSFKKYREKLKQKAEDLKNYLKGRIIPGTESFYRPKFKKQKVGTKWLTLDQRRSKMREYKKKRKAKIAKATAIIRTNSFRDSLAP